MTLLAAPSAEALAARRPHGKVWTPLGTPLGKGMKSVRGKDLAIGKLGPPQFPVPRDWKPSGHQPVAGSAMVALGADAGPLPRSLAGSAPAAGGQTPMQAGKLPVALAPAKRADGSARQVRVEVTDPAKGEAAGVRGPVVALTDTAPVEGVAHSVTVAIDVKALQGDGWSDRARLVALPACALTTPQLAECREHTPVASSVDARTGVVTAEVKLPGKQPADSAKSALSSGAHRAGTPQQGLLQTAAVGSSSATVLAAESAAGGAMGSYSASPLSPSAAWGAGSNTGSFTYSYPIQTPAAIGGSAPSVSLSYDSSSIDGKTSSTNAQASWVGEGWDYQPGFIERSYRSCDKDGISNSGDQCWAGWNAQLNLGGHSGTLVRDDATGTWRLQGDDGSKVERLTGAANEARNGEYWKVTTTDGTAFYFGANHLPGGGNSDPAANSVEYEPVYSPNSGDDCYDAAKGKASWCQEGWRWNLDYVVDPHQNLITFGYQQEMNNYSRGGGQNNGNGTLTAYVRAAELAQIAYGQRLPEQIAANGSAKPAAKVLFTAAERCTPNGSITCTSAQRTTANQSSWPDTPLDQNCAATGACTNYSPTFWSPLRLAKIETQVLVGTSYTTIDTWDLKFKFPDPGDGTKPSLWLSSIQRTGSNGQSAQTLPAVTFTERMLANRVDGLVPAEPAFNRPRMQQIVTETGGKITVNYQSTECSRINNTMPSSEDGNTRACMPVKWYLPGSSSPDPVKDWFHKYLVSSLSEQDAVTGPSLVKSTDYSYGGGAAWHRNDSELTEDNTRTWDEFRGYQTVTTTTGSAYPGEAPKTQQVSTYLRGMDGDRKADGSTRSVSVSFTPYLGATPVTRTDDNWLAGAVLGRQTYDKSGGAVVVADAAVASGDVVTATHKQAKGMPDLVARFTSTRSDSTSWGQKADGSWRAISSVATTDPTHGNRPLQVDDKGDGTAAVPEICSTNSYAVGSNPMMLTLVSRELTVTGPCGTTPNTSNTQKDSRTLFDGQPFGQAGATADPTSTQTIDSYGTDGNPVYTTLTTATFDAYGRPKTSAGPDGRVTTTDLTPTSGAIPTRVTLTGPMGAAWATSQTFDPGRSQPLVSTDANGRTTTKQYDGLGRLTSVWNADRATNLKPNYTFSYAVNGLTAPSVVTSNSLNEDESYSTRNDLYDGLGRLRQTQSTSAAGPGFGRLITDTLYDSHGWPVKKSSPYFDAANQPNGTVFAPQDSQVPAQDWATYDGQGRVASDAFVSYGQQQWTSSTAYPGVDRTDSTPPQGGQPSSTLTDARGRTTQLWQYRTATATGVASDANVTSYTYTAAGQPDKRTDSAGNVWSYVFDLRGRQTSVTDPDSGTTTTAYDANSRISSTTDAKGNTLLYTYDVLGRKTGMYAGSAAPTNQLAGWTYDTVAGAKGQVASSTRYVGGASGSAYTQAVTGYDTMYRPLGTSTTIPASEGSLKGTYTTGNQYSPILGSLIHTDLPALGGLPSEGVDYAYTNTGLLLASGGNSTLVTDVQHDPLGRPTRTTIGDWGTQVVSTQQYDWATGRVTQSFVDRQVSKTSLDQTGYTYNPAGQVTSATDLQSGSATDQQCFTYDYLGRLTNAWTDTAGTTTKPTGTWTDTSGTAHGSGTAQSVPGIGGCTNANGPAWTGTPSKPSVGGPSPYWQTYGYDTTGNRTGLVQHDTTGDTSKDVTTTQTFGTGRNTATNAPNTGGGTGGPHALLSSSVKSASGTKVTSYQYDVAGNTTGITDTAGTTALTWNGEDKLDTLAKSGQSQPTSYLYDADGSQLIRRDPGRTTLNLGADEVTLDTSSGTMSDVRYYSAPGGLTITRVTAATGGGKLVYQVSDPHGTNGVQIDTDAAQTVTRRPTDAFGDPRGTQPDASTWAGDKGFVGGTKDDVTGLTNLGAREYDPAHGRFLNPDPLLAEFDPQQWNGYAYSDNSPVDKADPSGLAWMCMDTCGARDRPRDGTPLSPVAQAEVDNAQIAHDQSVATTGSNGSGHGGNGGSGGHSKSKCGGFGGWLKCKAQSAAHAVVKVVREHPVIAAMVVTAVVVGGAACIIMTTGACAGMLVAAGEAALGGAEVGGVAGAITGAAVSVSVEGGVALGGAALATLGVGGAVAAQTAQSAEQSAGGVSARAAQPTAKEATETSKGARPSSEGESSCNSFPVGTQVKLADGTTKPIDRIQLGDEVTATDPQTGVTAPRAVTATIVTPNDEEFTDLTLSTAGPRAPPAEQQAITSTAHHPYWDITTQRWTNAADLKPGDHLRGQDGTTIEVVAARPYHTDPHTAYNLTVADLHTYYVLAGATPVLVHNCGPTGDEAAQEAQETLLHGPFHRKASPTQTDEHARLQQENGELWGGLSRLGGDEAAKAHIGPLPDGVRGVEFYTTIRPREPFPGYAWWEVGRVPGVRLEDGFAKIPIVISKNTQIG
ncbi:polymorphic toxin-type HINT domain-containing protein [Kitasatospora sp. GP82]|uniref:polymorphic toxin-type HINT domain-containing protein n=1 Tax=Kitasatospora sp. GP82 TaxID=3035089 RepID=UPI00247307FE|nr:polymorphic toxin-type HINT domain-containing protein [Kitasatospora sp. GP82]MDH6125525.1 RHS repeat-associated protein [Kitasatospora sp. GP82]